jgi:hypothetical protein
VSSHKSQWPLKWNGANPLHGGQDFNNMAPEKRVCAGLGLRLIERVLTYSSSSTSFAL